MKVFLFKNYLKYDEKIRLKNLVLKHVKQNLFKNKREGKQQKPKNTTYLYYNLIKVYFS